MPGNFSLIPGKVFHRAQANLTQTFTSMELIAWLLAILGLGGLGVTLALLSLASFNLFWAIFSAVLATRRGRSAANWFFLSCFYGIISFLLLLCSRTLDRERQDENDTLSKVLWTIVLLPVFLLILLLLAVPAADSGLHEREDDILPEEQTKQICLPQRMTDGDAATAFRAFQNWK